MKIRPTIVLFALAAILSAPVFAQNAQLGAPNPADIGKDQAQQLLKEVSVDRFEMRHSGKSVCLSTWALPAPSGWRASAGQPIRTRPHSGSRKPPVRPGRQGELFPPRRSVFHRSAREPHPRGRHRQDAVHLGGRKGTSITPKVLFTDFNGQEQSLTVGMLNFVGGELDRCHSAQHPPVGIPFRGSDGESGSPASKLTRIGFHGLTTSISMTCAP